MQEADIKAAVAEIAGEQDPTLKSVKLASLCSALFRERGIELVVVGGSAIEIYTDGAYTSGDLDLCILAAKTPLTLRLRQELMGKLGGLGGPRSWQVAGAYVDVLGHFESLAQTELRRVAGPYGQVSLGPPEELLVERVLVSVYPGLYPPARECASKLAAAGLAGEVQFNWAEVDRLASRPEYDNLSAVKELVNETAKALNYRSPYDSDR